MNDKVRTTLARIIPNLEGDAGKPVCCLTQQGTLVSGVDGMWEVQEPCKKYVDGGHYLTWDLLCWNIDVGSFALRRAEIRVVEE